MKESYFPFSNFVLRTPLLSLSFYKKLTSEHIISTNKLKEIFSNLIIKEAIFLASPAFYKELEKWERGYIKDSKQKEKIEYSFLKYVSRMSSRCTPFGLFAGCELGKIENKKTEIILKSILKYNRHTRLDMNYLVALSKNLVNNPIIQSQLLFYPNTSIYSLGSQLRYVEYEYVNGRREHNITAVEKSEYLDIILKGAKKGATKQCLALLLTENQISIKESKSFIEELIDSQLLISELEPSVSGPEFLQQILQVLSKFEKTEFIVEVLEDVVKGLEEIDSNFGNNIEKYREISEILQAFDIDFDKRFLIQSDLITKSTVNNLNINVISSIKKGISLLNKATIPSENTLLNHFKNAFKERYGDREVSLSKVLDVENGIGYIQNQPSLEINPLIDDIILPAKQSSRNLIEWSSINSIINNKILMTLRNDEFILKLTDDDFIDYNENWDDLPDTMSTMIEVVCIGGQQKIKFDGIAGSSAGNLLTRFCFADNKLKAYTKQIIDFEGEINANKLKAEIVHLPESRLGNILMRPSFRKYEIPYLAKSLLPNEQQIEIDDLYISIKNNEIILRSKKHNKHIIPYLTNAHNFNANSLPIYHFLCDMQKQNKRSFLGLDIGFLREEFKFIPRIEYNDLILSEASWLLNKNDIALLLKYIEKNDLLLLAVKNFRREFRMPKFVCLVDGDNELLINLDNLTSVRMLLSTVRKRDNFRLTEFLFGEENIVKNENGEHFTHQLILSFYNQNKIKNG